MLETLLRKDDVDERCGVLLKDGTVVELANLADDPRKSFEMDLEPVLDHIDADAIEAMWHTHPDEDPTLSGDDHSCFLSWPDLEHIIIGIRDGNVVVLRYRVEQGLVIECD